MKSAVPSGVIVVDKPQGWTSHDVVARARKLLGERSIGHAGTLDPMATGVLLLCVGEGTKLVSWLTASHKQYEATLRLGVTTRSLDADGEVTDVRPPSAELLVALAGKEPWPALQEALAAERGRTSQEPPLVSAIKVQGRAAHARERAGESFELAERAVEVIDLQCVAWRPEPPELALVVDCSKGYYVRSLGRDLAHALGTVGHLVALRRMRSGIFGLEQAATSMTREGLLAALVPLAAAACSVLPSAVLTPDGERKARLGQRLGPEHFIAPAAETACAWLAESGSLVAIGSLEDGSYRVQRGFTDAR